MNNYSLLCGLRPAALAVTVCCLGWFQPATAETQTIEIPLSRPGEPVEVEIDAVYGDIEVVGQARNDVALEVSHTGADGGRRIVTPSGTRMIPLSSYALEVEEEDNQISIDADPRAHGIIIRALVPLRSDLAISAVHAEQINVSGVSGELELENVNGGIVARDIGGSVIAETVNGNISIELDSVESGKAMAFTTVNGDVELSFPADFAADISIDSRQDEIYSDFDVDFKQQGPTIKRDARHHGGVSFELEQTLNFSINGGGTSVRVETLNGEVSLRKSTR